MYLHSLFIYNTISSKLANYLCTGVPVQEDGYWSCVNQWAE